MWNTGYLMSERTLDPKRASTEPASDSRPTLPSIPSGRRSVAVMPGRQKPLPKDLFALCEDELEDPPASADELAGSHGREEGKP